MGGQGCVQKKTCGALALEAALRGGVVLPPRSPPEMVVKVDLLVGCLSAAGLADRVASVRGLRVSAVETRVASEQRQVETYPAHRPERALCTDFTRRCRVGGLTSLYEEALAESSQVAFQFRISGRH